MRKKTKNKTPIFNKIVLGLNITVAILLLLSYLAPYSDPRDYSIIAILGLGLPILYIVNVLFLIYWIIVRKAMLALVSGFSVLIGFTYITLYIGFDYTKQPEKKASEEIIRIMEYNVHDFRGIEEHDGQPILNDVFELIKEKQPDIINFVDFNDKLHATDSLKKIFKYNYYKSFYTSKLDTSGNAIFSKYPIIKYGFLEGAKLLNLQVVFVDIKKDNKIIRIYCPHMATINMSLSKRRDYLEGNVSINQSSIIENKLTSAFYRRSLQVNKIKRHIDDCPYPYIFAGDFNDTPISYTVNEFGDGIKNAFKEKGAGFVTTYNSKYPLQIDFIFASNQFDIINYKVIDKKLSDHKPVISDLRLN
jgi:endonuclease/exonuclease/phosphatase family metal-dependent hydrolase